jgi:hypothetical protein
MCRIAVRAKSSGNRRKHLADLELKVTELMSNIEDAD